MKLKRFLLRFQPPGVGLDVEGQGIVHKDLLPVEEVTTLQDVQELAESIIVGEPELLTRRKHRAALVSLLGRLYQVDVSADTGTDGPEAAGDTQEPAQPTLTPREETEAADHLHEGQEVILIGLKAKQIQFNGESGTLTKARPDKSKYEVLLPAGPAREQPETVKVKGVLHIVPVCAKGSTLNVGSPVVIRGLRNHVELNGCLGRVAECHREAHRFEVRAIESGQLFRVKQENLVAIESCPQMVNVNEKENRDANANATPRMKKDPGSSGAGLPAADGAEASDPFGGPEETFEPGAMVVLQGLKTAMVYNGQTAEVTNVDKARGRYEIRLQDGSVKTIRAENVRAAAGGSTKATPRTKRKDGGPKGADRPK